ncbi:capsule biosynthesis GfcC family protein [Umboniibacter marinipuniceus]|nr:capsule biosynthesis GfcC family protein [Umboniibacter marinipuniceus]
MSLLVTLAPRLVQAQVHPTVIDLKDASLPMEKSIGFQQTVRLSQALDYVRAQHASSSAQNGLIDWDSSGLFQAPSPQRVEQREHLLRLLSEVQESEECNTASLLKERLSEAPLLSKFALRVGYDSARLKLKDNPLLPGRYTLHLAAFAQAPAVLNGSGTTAVLEASKRLMSAHLDQLAPPCGSGWALLSTSTGVRKIGYESWNDSDVPIPESATIVYLGSGWDGDIEPLLIEELTNIGALLQ